jgi:hypothetical protein
MRTRFVLITVLLLTILLGAASPAGAASALLNATLTAAAVPTQGDPAASGFAYAVVDDANDRICVVVFSTGGSTPTAVHVHKAPAGQIGPHAIDLNNPVGPALASVSTGCYTAPEAVLDDIAANPSGYYVNVHSETHPLGSIRGQLSPVFVWP